MSLVTITDHNSIAGAMEIVHLPDTFLSEEVTTYFPEDRCKVHVLVFDITEGDHADIQHLRENIFELLPFLRKKGIHHAVAHPLFDGRRTSVFGRSWQVSGRNTWRCSWTIKWSS